MTVRGIVCVHDLGCFLSCADLFKPISWYTARVYMLTRPQKCWHWQQSHHSSYAFLGYCSFTKTPFRDINKYKHVLKFNNNSSLNSNLTALLFILPSYIFPMISRYYWQAVATHLSKQPSKTNMYFDYFYAFHKD